MRLPPYLWLLLFAVTVSACQAEEQASAPASPLIHVVDTPVPPPLPPLSDGFDFPVGPPDAKGYYNAQVFGKNEHLGDDWNGTGGGNSDLGDPVFSVAHGLVVYAEDHAGGWGNVVRVQHRLKSGAEEEMVESLYAHLDTILVKVGDTLERGQQIGTIGDAHGAYYAHLHLEMRDSLELSIGGGYGESEGYLDPTAFIRAHRPGAENSPD